jgi:membrane protein DedA with SNARE-associated domain
MTETVEFLVRHGYLVLFGVVLGEQLGLPLVGAPLLLATGALAAGGRLSAPLGVALAVLACLLGDSVWYRLGRSRGGSVLALLCRIALETDSCVRRTEDTFARHGGRVLLVAKFLPGLNTVAPPLSGIVGMPYLRFVALDGAGALAWAGAYVGLGYLASREIEAVAAALGRLGWGAGLVVGAALSLYVGWKLWLRRRFLRSLRMARITPAELARRLEAGDTPVIVDLRSPVLAAAEAFRIPGALRIRPDELELRYHEIALDREIVLYCT